MKRNITVATLLGLAMTATALHAADEGTPLEKAPQASIPFVNTTESIRDWQADGTQGIWVQDVRRQWYYAQLIGPCHGLDFAISVGFEARVSNTLDRFASIVVPNFGRCALNSFTKSEAPPPKERRKAAKGKAENSDAAASKAE